MADRTVVYRFRGDISDLQAKMVNAGQSVRKAANEMTSATVQGAKFRQGLTSVGDTAGRVGVAAAAGLGLVAKSAMDWESAWAGVQKTVSGSTSEMATLEGQLRDLAKTLPASHQEIAAVAEAAGQLGVQREAVAGFTETMINLGETTNLTAEEAATSIARFANIMGTPQTEVDRLGSSLVELGNNSATTEAEILAMGQRLAAAGSIAGLSEGDVLGFAAALTSVGVEAEAGGTAMSKTFTAMRDAVIDGGDKLDVFARTAGMTAQEFTSAWNADPAATIDSFVSGLGEINASGESTSAVFKSLGLTDQRLSRALLSAAEAGELLGDSLDMGNTGFEENTALAIEAAKRYETTAAQVRIAWNGVKDAAIDFGEVALPLLASGAEKAAAFAQAVGSLPAPVKAASTSMLGMTAVLGGGLWFTAKTISGVSDMRVALTNLTGSSTKASKALKGVGAASGGLVALIAGASAIRAIQAATDDAVPGLEALTGQLIDLANTPTGVSVQVGEIDTLAESLRRISDRSFTESFGDAMQTPFEGLFGEAGSLRQARKEVEGFDASMALLANSGAPETAAAAFDRLAASLDLSDGEKNALLDLMPQYAEALAGIENDAALAADATDQHTASVDRNSDGVIDNTDALLENIDAMREKRSEALRGLNAELNYQESLDDARKALKENGKTLDKTTEKGRANRRALYDVAAAWNDQSAAAKNAPGAHRAAIRSFVDLATKMGMPIKKAQQLAREILELPDKKVKVEADTSQARSAIGDIRATLDRLNGKSATTYVRVVRTGIKATQGDAGGNAEGGYISGPGGPTDDLIPSWLSNGEYVVKAAAVAKYGTAMFDRLNAMQYANGGYVQPRKYASGGNVDPLNRRDFRGFNLEGDLGVRGVRSELAEFRKAIRDAGGDWTKAMRRMSTQAVRTVRAYERADSKLDRLVSARASLTSDVRDNFNNDIFGNGLSGAFTQLEADRNDARSQTREMRRLRRLGLNGAAFRALAASGDLNTMSQIDTRGEVRRLERLYAQRAQAQNSSARYAGQAEYGRQIRQQNRLIGKLERKLDRLEGAVERGARRGTAQVAGNANSRRKAGR